MIALWMIYSTLVAALVGGAAALLDRATAGRVRQRRWVWMFAVVLAVLLPLWTAFAPSTPSVDQVGTEPAAQGRPSTVAAGVTDGMATRLAALLDAVQPSSLGRFDTTLVIFWAIAASLAISAYGVASWSLARRRRSWRRTSVDGQAVLLAPAVGPAVIGAIRPEIVVPVWSLELSADQRALMLEHERQHVRARDPLVLHAAAMLALMMPWNIAAWWLNRRLRLAVELDCDARVLATGRDVRSYGTLLLDVCSRRTRTGALLAPALLERTSSLAQRIMAMQPDRGRYPRARIALGSAAACLVVLLACEMPTPEMLAPDGKDAAPTRVYGHMIARFEDSADEPRQLIARYFPAVARGEGGPSILFVVRSATGAVVLTETQPADFALMPALQRESVSTARAGRTPSRAGIVGNGLRMRGRTGLTELRIPGTGSKIVSGTPLFKSERQRSAPTIPAAVGALRPNDIASVDVSKHAAGAVASQPVSIVTIVLTAGAMVPQVTGAH